LINASPDLSTQIRSFPDLQPGSDTPRNSPISTVFLTNADLDHVLGLFSLREGGRLHIHATSAIRDSLDHALGLTDILDAFCGVVWHEPVEGDLTPVVGTHGEPSSLAYRAIRLPGGPPLFARGRHPDGAHSIAYYILDKKSGGRLLVAPDVGGGNEALTAAMHEADAVLFDGTFWSEDELQRINPKAKTAAQMGHVTIRDQSLALLSSCRARHKVYFHINNTNPVLAPHSPERAAVFAAGVTVAHDGLEFFI
jgi:pyrroloquinoline quinone biosynthesis protein B